MISDHPLELFGALKRTRLENDNIAKVVEKIEAVVSIEKTNYSPADVTR